MDDLISEFITETSESLSILDSELVKLEQNPNDSGILGNIFRLVHTIKGTCGFIGLSRLEKVAHAGENVLGKIRDGEMNVSPEGVSLILEALDTIKSIMDYLGQHGEEPEGSDADLIVRLNKFAETGKAEAAGAAPAAPAPAPMKAAAAEPEPDEFGFVPVTAEQMLQALEAEKADAGKAEEKEEVAEEKPVEKPVELPPAVKKEAIEKGLKTEVKNPSAGGGNAGQTIRVSLGVLENLMSMVGELVLTRNQLMQVVRTKLDDDFKVPLQRLSYITTELQEGVMKTRMQPIGNAWANFPRLIRDLSLELGKKIELRMIGAETELDRQLLEVIKDPLTHMVRNSCDHGLEMPDDRIRNKKPETGTVTLSAYHEGGHIIVDISDDGRGVNIARIKEKILENSLASKEELAHMSDQQIIQYIFRAGFSTAEKVTSVSGRGVGMDVVRTNIEKIGGTVELESVPGKGSTFHIKIPLTLAIVSVLIVAAAKQRFAIPQINVIELVRTGGTNSEFRIEMINRSPVLRLREKLLPLVSLSGILGLEQEGDVTPNYVVVCKVGAAFFGLLVDTIYDTEEIVVKPVSLRLQGIPLYSGNTVLGDGSVIMILDPNGIGKTLAGELDMSMKNEELSKGRLQGSERTVPFLLFRSGEDNPKAVPLELVSRLEEIYTKDIEYSNQRPVVQYRGDLMVLTTLGGKELPKKDICEVIVFHYDQKTVGLVVDEIQDIVNAPAEVKLAGDNKDFMGTIVMAERSTDVIDVGHLLARVLDMETELNIKFPNEKKTGNLLFVEDSLFFRNLIVPVLSAVGYRVTAAPDGIEALKILQKKKFDVIVTDIEMPEMDGFELAKAIRALPECMHMPIIAFTSTSNEGFHDKVTESGINNYVLKTEREQLIQLISDFLTHKEEAIA